MTTPRIRRAKPGHVSWCADQVPGALRLASQDAALGVAPLPQGTPVKCLAGRADAPPGQLTAKGGSQRCIAPPSLPCLLELTGMGPCRTYFCVPVVCQGNILWASPFAALRAWLSCCASSLAQRVSPLRASIPHALVVPGGAVEAGDFALMRSASTRVASAPVSLGGSRPKGFTRSSAASNFCPSTVAEKRL